MKRGQIFSTTPINRLKKSAFPLDYFNQLTTEMARLTPVMCQEVLPGDTISNKDVVMTRLLPMLSPAFGRIDCTIRYFFVPNRLLWNKWQNFITGGSDGNLEPSKVRVRYDDLVNEGLVAPKTLGDYFNFGDPQRGAHYDEIEVDIAPWLAYNLIYQEYYRDQNLGEDLSKPIEYLRNTEGLITTSQSIGDDEDLNDYDFWSLRNKCWKKDYFTSALPWAQRGPAVTIPIGTSAPVTIPAQLVNLTGSGGEDSGDPILLSLPESGPGNQYALGVDLPAGATTGSLINVQDENVVTNIFGKLGGFKVGEPQGALTGTANLAAVTGISINELRLLARLQRWAEMNAVGGGRYVEQTLAHWDEIIPDYTIQRPQYLGGGSFPVQISEVLQTSLASSSGTTSATAAGVGQMYGHGLGLSSKPGFKRRHFTEHGWIIGLLSIMPHVSYFQGLPRKFTRFDKFDYAWYEMAHLGEQEVLNKEIYVDSDNPDGTFGYQSRYAEYKYNNDEVHGDFRSSLLYWTLARKFDGEPELNANFMKASPINRIFAVTDQTYDHFLVYIHHDLKSSRKLPKYGQPGIHIL